MSVDIQRERIRGKLNAIFCDVFDDDAIVISDATTAKDIPGWDSLMQITLVVAAEKAFSVKLNARAIGKLANVGEMVDTIAGLTADK